MDVPTLDRDARNCSCARPNRGMHHVRTIGRTLLIMQDQRMLGSKSIDLRLTVQLRALEESRKAYRVFGPTAIGTSMNALLPTALFGIDCQVANDASEMKVVENTGDCTMQLTAVKVADTKVQVEVAGRGRGFCDRLLGRNDTFDRM